jgi:hypothetical protein
LDLLKLLDAEAGEATRQIVELWRVQAGELLPVVKAARERYGQFLDDADLVHLVAKQLPATRAETVSAAKQLNPVTRPSTVRAVNRGNAAGHSRIIELVAVLGFLADQEHPPSGQTLRQVSIPGVQGKWLESNQKLLASVLGTDPFAEVVERVRRVQLTYLDPDHLAQPNARRYDVYVRDQKHQLEYVPRVVLICENNECADRFPQVPGAIAVRGEGTAVAGLLRSPQLVEAAEHLVYWGDIDEQGLNILATLRQKLRGNGYPKVRSILMDYAAYQKYSMDAGTNQGADNRDITVENLDPKGLDLGEQRAFDVVTGPVPAPYRRIEQERIPLEDAREALRALIGDLAGKESAGSGQSTEVMEG